MPGGRPSRATILAHLATALDELRQFGGLPAPVEAGTIWDDIWHLEAHNSTALDGNTLVLREVERLLDIGQAIDAPQLTSSRWFSRHCLCTAARRHVVLFRGRRWPVCRHANRETLKT